MHEHQTVGEVSVARFQLPCFRVRPLHSDSRRLSRTAWVSLDDDGHNIRPGMLGEAGRLGKSLIVRWRVIADSKRVCRIRVREGEYTKAELYAARELYCRYVLVLAMVNQSSATINSQYFLALRAQRSSRSGSI